MDFSVFRRAEVKPGEGRYLLGVSYLTYRKWVEGQSIPKRTAIAARAERVCHALEQALANGDLPLPEGAKSVRTENGFRVRPALLLAVKKYLSSV